MMGWISAALIRRVSAKISETAPGRTPIAAARPPLVLPGFVSPRSIILVSSMAPSFPNFRNYSNSDYPKSSLTLISEYQKLIELLDGGITGMQSTNWAPEHSDALREYLAKGMSYSGIFDAINANGLRPPKDLPGHWPRRPPKAKAPGLRKLRERHPPEFIRPMPVSERTEVVKLRCVEIAPRHLSLIDLEPG